MTIDEVVLEVSDYIYCIGFPITLTCKRQILFSNSHSWLIRTAAR